MFAGNYVWSGWRWAAVEQQLPPPPADLNPLASQGRISAVNAADASRVLAIAKSMTDKISALYADPRLQQQYMQYWAGVAQKEYEDGQIMANAPDGVRRAEAGAISLEVRKLVRIYQVESDYYDWSYERRMYSFFHVLL
ncbi:hypothetical protein HDU82_007186 [Entophlyctis luteolus]|nr:hypothetical protein HDU82_007186 [Entophlyctis luteolus]